MECLKSPGSVDGVSNVRKEDMMVKILAKKPTNDNPRKRITLKRDTTDNISYWMYMLPWMIVIFLFRYLPVLGEVIAFQDYKGGDIIGANTKWVGLKWFKEFFESFYFGRIMRNTVKLSLMNLFMGFWVPIAFALLLNELRFTKLRKTIQTLSYMPYFISSVIVASMFLGYISDTGIIVKILSWFGVEVSTLNTNMEFMPWYYTLVNVWKSFGWNSILYLSTITSIDPGLYEAAELDGAGRWKRMWHVTLPHMKPIIMIQLIFAVGNLLASNTEMMLLMYNSSIYETMDVIGTYMYRDGLLGGRFSYGSACGLVMSTFGFILTYIANKVSDKAADFSLW